MPQHTCPECGQDFYSRKSARTYCSQRCYDIKRKRQPGPTVFKPGHDSDQRLPLGAITVRKRHNRKDGPRAWVKVAQPNVWRPRAVLVWEQTHGPVPQGCVVHHVDRDTLNDSPENLVVIDRATHLLEHRPEFESKRRRSVSRRRHISNAP